MSSIRHNLVMPPGPGDSHARPLDLENLIRDVIDTVSVQECEVQDRQGHWFCCARALT